MEPLRIVDAALGALGLLLIAATLYRMARTAHRLRRAGVATTAIGVTLTTTTIGLGAALAVAIAGGGLIASTLPFGGMTSLIIQVVAAFTLSWVTSRIYFTWLAQPVSRWFAGEEDSTLGC